MNYKMLYNHFKDTDMLKTVVELENMMINEPTYEQMKKMVESFHKDVTVLHQDMMDRLCLERVHVCPCIRQKVARMVEEAEMEWSRTITDENPDGDIELGKIFDQYSALLDHML